LKKGGFLVSIVGKPSKELAKKYKVKAKHIASVPNPKQLEEITKLAEDDKIIKRI